MPAKEIQFPYAAMKIKAYENYSELNNKRLQYSFVDVSSIKAFVAIQFKL